MASGKRNMTPASFVSVLMMPTMLTMFVSGVWHGAGYTYIVWGLMHGALISINHAWRLIRPRIWPAAKNHARFLSTTGFIMTFTSVVVAMVMFRAPTVTAAMSIWGDMLGGHGVTLPDGVLARLGPVAVWLHAIGVHADGAGGAVMLDATLRIALLLVIVLCLPNPLEILGSHEPALGVKPAKQPSWLLRQSQWSESAPWAVGTATLAATGILSLGQLSEFLYWQF